MNQQPKPDKFCFILRGLPGTGKTTIADLLANSISLFRPEDGDIPIINTDKYFERSGRYHFDKTELETAHKNSWQNFKAEISAGKKIIIVDNTNIKKYHYIQYLDYAQRHGYLTSIITIPHNDLTNKELAARNIHSVDQETIRRMRQNFEWEI